MKSLRYYNCICGSNFKNPVLKTEQESRGEFWGVPCFEDMTYAYCPYCGSDDISEEYIDEDSDNFEEVCEDVENSPEVGYEEGPDWEDEYRYYESLGAFY